MGVSTAEKKLVANLQIVQHQSYIHERKQCSERYVSNSSSSGRRVSFAATRFTVDLHSDRFSLGNNYLS